MSNEEDRVKIKIAAERRRTRVYFEPIGTDFSLEPGDEIFLDVPLEDLRELEVEILDHGVAFNLPYRGVQLVLDKQGNVLEQL